MGSVEGRRQLGHFLPADPILWVLRQPVGRGEQPRQGFFGRRRGVAGDERPGLDAVEQLVDGLLGVGRDEHRRSLPSMGDRRLGERCRQRLPIVLRPLVESVLDGILLVAEEDRERTELVLEPGEQGIGARLELLGYDELLVGPHVGDVLVGERR